MKGFKIVYLSNLVCKQEIPPTIRSWIIQQSRWAKGFSQNIKKNYLEFLFMSIKSSFTQTIQGTIHLTQYLVPLMILVNTTTTVLIMYSSTELSSIFRLFGIIFTFSAICGILAYCIAIFRTNRPKSDIILIPLFLFWGAGLIVRMSAGTIEGFLKKGGKFERTPKFNLGKSTSKISVREYIPLDWVVFLEIIYLLILIAGIIKALDMGIYFLFTGFYFIFIGLSVFNLIISELIHGIGYRH